MTFDEKIYLAGHAGMLGSAIDKKLQSAGFKNIIKRTSRELDLRRQAGVESFFEKEKPEVVILSAAKVGGILANKSYPAEFIYDNLMIEANVIHSTYKFGVKKLIFIASAAVYPPSASQPMSENELLNGKLEPNVEPYAIAKIAGVKLCSYYKKQYGCDFITLVPTNLYGLGDNYNLETSHVLPALLRKMILGKALIENNFKFIKNDLKNNPLGFGIELSDSASKNEIIEALEKCGIRQDSVYIWGSGNAKREFMHVEDFADSLLYFLQFDNSKNQIGELLNIGTGVETSIKELAEVIKNIVGYNGNLDFDKNKPDGALRKLLDSSKARTSGWNHKIELNEGIKLLAKSYYNKSLK